MQYSQAASFAPCARFFRSSFSPACIAFSWQGMFFIYFRVISHEFVSASLRKPCGFFRWFLTGLPLILFLSNHGFLKQYTNEISNAFVGLTLISKKLMIHNAQVLLTLSVSQQHHAENVEKRWESGATWGNQKSSKKMFYSKENIQTYKKFFQIFYHFKD